MKHCYCLVCCFLCCNTWNFSVAVKKELSHQIFLLVHFEFSHLNLIMLLSFFLVYFPNYTICIILKPVCNFYTNNYKAKEMFYKKPSIPEEKCNWRKQLRLFFPGCSLLIDCIHKKPQSLVFILVSSDINFHTMWPANKMIIMLRSQEGKCWEKKKTQRGFNRKWYRGKEGKRHWRGTIYCFKSSKGLNNSFCLGFGKEKKVAHNNKRSQLVRSEQNVKPRQRTFVFMQFCWHV